ncbi:acetyltransferase, GNAT family protein [Oceanicola granulosus HTCC2516]|uniref:Acetyltransferase, GNAT family protein n=1 Tax=Oceanicola granulosus (strain ATCC BAA-861 / DSM 15982 / KCTC 12143 / HTCC2516) TaxID=314256 RepID=Q2CA07_OCEGH|nr:GNAT family N-acetyltransferase [Oceanicola granulosus]EAR49503.1 acetyltransferase, GNAT family protein [Oceanicola granulosus HTCC2516]
MPLHITAATDPADIALCRALRHEVFVEEQGVSIEDEDDGEDHLCRHVLARLDGRPVGTARFRYKDGAAKVQRVCVARAARGRGIGADLIRHVSAVAAEEGEVARVRLGAQTHALDFYRRLGFEVVSEEYDDAGIPHRDMELAL